MLIKNVKPEGSAPVVLISHGPPEGKGKTALDYIFDKKNVGDPLLNRLIERAGIPFGIHGHILEAGGRGVAKDMKTVIKQGKMSANLFVNAGSLSGDPWGMLDGRTGWGMAMLFTIDGKKAKYEVKSYRQRE